MKLHDVLARRIPVPCCDLCSRDCDLARTSETAIGKLFGAGCRELAETVAKRYKLDGERLESLRRFINGTWDVAWLHEAVGKVRRAFRNARPPRRPRPPSWGMEVELNPYYLDELVLMVTDERYDGHYDGSGPWEFTIGPWQVGDRAVIDLCLALADLGGEVISYKPYYGEMGCHVHYRPARESTPKAWAYAFANAFFLSLFLPKLLCHHDHGSMWRFRHKLYDWARLRTDQLNAALAYLVSGNEWERDEWERELREFDGRRYDVVTLNRNRKDTLTIEVRISEAFPTNAWAWVAIVDAYTRNRTLPVAPKEVRREALDEFYWLFTHRLDLDLVVDLGKMGLECAVCRKQRLTLRELAESVIEHAGSLPTEAYEIVRYVYGGGRIVDFETFKEFAAKVGW